MTTIDPIYTGPDALPQLIDYCEARGFRRFALVADTNTYRALGARAQEMLAARGYEVTAVVLEGEEIVADERHLIQTLLRAPLGDCVFLGVGAGTLTDITRFVSHRSGRPFISLPTAPSVDGFTSIGAPLVLNGVKQTITEQAPLAVFADLDTLRNAPRELIAAGFGDVVGKLTAVADWRLGTLLWDEPYDEAIARRSEAAVASCIEYVDAIGQRSEEGIRRLMDALIETGLCILDFGTSSPASGSEHHASHFWEMELLKAGRPAILHGAKVGFALTLMARQYERLRALDRQAMLNRLEAAAPPDRAAEIAHIQEGFGALAGGVIAGHGPFLDQTPADFEQLKRRIAEHWDEVQAIAASVLPVEEIAALLRQAGAATDGAALGLSAEEVARGLEYGHYLRNRFTVIKLSRVLGLPLTSG
jgi:glycerol-1-phosphate dehydrogenase [NAD(P)+]